MWVASGNVSRCTLGLLLLACCPRFAYGQAAVSTVPVTMLGHVLLRADVAGAPAWLVLDPIAGMILDQRWARQHAIPLVDGVAAGLGRPAMVGGAGSERREALFIRNATLRVGSVHETGQRLALPLDSLLAISIGHRVDGLIGLTAFDGYIVEVSATDGQLRLHPRGGFVPPSGAQRMPVRYDRGIRPLVSVQLSLPGGRTTNATAYFDLGMSGSLRLTTRFADSLGLAEEVCGPDRIAAPDSSEVGLGGVLASIRTRLPAVRLHDDAPVESLVVTLARERDGADAAPAWDVLVGWSLMRRHDWWFDAHGGRLWFRPNPRALSPEGSAQAGLEFAPLRGEPGEPLVVAAVSGASVAAGVLVGDTLLRLDQQHVAGSDAERVRTQLSWSPARAHPLVLRRGGPERRVLITPREVLRAGGCGGG